MPTVSTSFSQSETALLLGPGHDCMNPPPHSGIERRLRRQGAVSGIQKHPGRRFQPEELGLMMRINVSLATSPGTRTQPGRDLPNDSVEHES